MTLILQAVTSCGVNPAGVRLPVIRRAAVGLSMALIAVAAGCAGPSAAPSSSVPSAEPSPGSATLNCGALELRTPEGHRLDLTGTWEGSETIHYIRQLGDCVWWIALSNWPGQVPGAFYSITFNGHLNADFTVTGEWAVIVIPRGPGTPATEGLARFTVDISEESGVETVVLSRVGEGPSEGGYHSATLHYVGPLPASVAP